VGWRAVAWFDKSDFLAASAGDTREFGEEDHGASEVWGECKDYLFFRISYLLLLKHVSVPQPALSFHLFYSKILLE
jgi:hypothetical protein